MRETDIAPNFDDVRPGDEIRFQRIYRGFVGGGEIRNHTGTGERVTANTVFLIGGTRLLRSSWYGACVRRAVVRDA